MKINGIEIIEVSDFIDWVRNGARYLANVCTNEVYDNSENDPGKKSNLSKADTNKIRRETSKELGNIIFRKLVSMLVIIYDVDCKIDRERAIRLAFKHSLSYDFAEEEQIERAIELCLPRKKRVTN